MCTLGSHFSQSHYERLSEFQNSHFDLYVYIDVQS